MPKGIEKILAFDLATNTGVAYGDVRHGPVAHTEKLGEAGPAHGPRFSQLFELTMHLIRTKRPDLIAIESPLAAGVPGGANRAKLAMGLRASVLIAAHWENIRVEEYAVQTIRKYFIGKFERGKAKRLTIDRCLALGWRVENDNEADACAVWALAREKNGLGSVPNSEGLFDHAARKDTTPP